MFSIIMPVWNRTDFVDKAIESVLSQTFEEYELIIIDDGSEDNLEEVVQPYLCERVKYFRIPHSGCSAARNFGLRQARYPFIAYLDSDNRWHPNFLTTMHDALQSVDSPCEVAYCMANRCRKDPATGKLYRDDTIGEPFSFKKLLAGNYIDLNTFVHSRKAVEYAGVFDENLERLVDWDLVIRVTSLFEPVFVPKVLVDYYLGIADNAVTITKDLESADQAIHKKYMALDKPITVFHDTIAYCWQHLPEKKYYNWVRMSHEQFNTTDYTAWGYPWLVQVEPTNMCNLACPLCPVTRNILHRERRNMTFNEFKTIVDDMEDYLLLIVLWDWGEPFMNPELPKMIAYAAERDIRTVTSTNGHFLEDETYVEAILKAGLSTLIVAIDSLEDDNYTTYRKKGMLSKALGGLQSVVNIKRRIGGETLINLRMVVMRHNEHEIRKMRRVARQIGVDRFTVKTVNLSLNSNVHPEQMMPRNPKYQRLAYKPGSWERIPIDGMCRHVWNVANINVNGDVVGCCYDYDALMKVGNIREQPLSELWNGPAYREHRKKVYHEMRFLPRCSECWVNFKLSESGWFPESINLTESTMVRLKNRIKGQLRRTPAWPVLRAGKNSLRKVDWIARNKIFQYFKGHSCIDTPPLLSSQIRTLDLPLKEDNLTGWKAYDIFKGSTYHLKNFSCHVSVLSPGKAPHQPHEHAEEEILIMLSGEADLVIIDTKQGQIEKRHSLRPGSFVYYPAWQWHTINNPRTQSATYLMFKWDSEQLDSNNMLETSTVQFLEGEHYPSYPSGKSFATTRVLDGGTQYLRKLHCHITTLQPGSGYPPHDDPYDVAILVLRGNLETLGQRISPNSVIFYAAGEPHGMKNVGTSPALYLVFEFHGDILDQSKNSTKLKYGNILPVKALRFVKNSLLTKADKSVTF